MNNHDYLYILELKRFPPFFSFRHGITKSTHLFPFLVLFIAMVIVASLPAHAASRFGFFGPSGGPGGNSFNDHLFVVQLGDISRDVGEITIRAGKYIDAVNIGFRAGGSMHSSVDQHGGTGGQRYVFKLGQGEKIISMNGTYGKYVHQLQFHTDRNRSSRVYGGDKGPASFHYRAPSNCSIVGFTGRSGAQIDAIGVVLRCGD